MRRTVATKSKDRLWDQGVIPFIIDDVFSGSQRKLIKEAMRVWEKSTCITFVETVPDVLHELGHAIGLEHEHIRPDRDMFIDVIYENIPEEFFSEFEKGSAHDVQTFNQTYDYHSVMHYPSDAFSIYWPLETLLPKQENLSLGNIKLSRYCGNFSSIRIKTNNVLFVTYVKSTTSNPSIGFTAHYNIICGGIFDIKVDTPFNLESTNFPDAYPPNRRCSWKFTAPNNHRIAMKIHYFELELNDNCIDFLMIKDGIDYNSKVIGVYCGERDSWQINSTDNKLLVIFSSDSIINYSGFSATLFAIPLDG
ncbi:Similar to TLL2: Tolloid-like protein 2 (Homo sapiens) [Cotesia congregata]|uniref:Metalloendopeptidase n=1 Tax=Cotesia congregata TaxID=51543 RepID=A0A8J2HAI2_COTCN|nr:Similar to TLL2: Tolloid-like protein 2 (Homo sapiens) [Cotesia congregata]